MDCSKCGAPLPYGTYGNVRCEHCNGVTYVPLPEERREMERGRGEKPKEAPAPAKVEAPPPAKAKKGGLLGRILKSILIMFGILFFIGLVISLSEDQDNGGNDIIDGPTPTYTTPPYTLSPTTAPPVTIAPQPLPIFDPFDSNVYAWPTGLEQGEYATLERSLSNGRYRWDVLAHKDVYTYAYPSLEQASDFYLTVDARLESGITNSAYGVVFRLVDGDNFYYLALSDANKFSFFVKYGGEWITLVDWTATSAIRPGEMNRIWIIAEGSKFSFFINDQFVAGAEDDRLTGGNVGLAVSVYEAGARCVFEFDNFELDNIIQEPQYIASWKDEKNGVYSVDIWDLRESDIIYEKGKAEEGATLTAGIGNKFIILGATITKQRDTPSSWPLRFELVDDRDKNYKEYTLSWRVAGYLNKNIATGESDKGLLVFQIPKQMKAAKLYCVGCSGDTRIGQVVDVSIGLG